MVVFPKLAESLSLIRTLDSEVRPHILQVAIDPEDYVAEIYTSDKQLLQTLTLGEGRQRYEEFDPEAQRRCFIQRKVQPLFDELTEAEQELEMWERKRKGMKPESEEVMQGWREAKWKWQQINDKITVLENR